jgi:hypothetical protein
LRLLRDAAGDSPFHTKSVLPNGTHFVPVGGKVMQERLSPSTVQFSGAASDRRQIGIDEDRRVCRH